MDDIYSGYVFESLFGQSFLLTPDELAILQEYLARQVDPEIKQEFHFELYSLLAQLDQANKLKLNILARLQDPEAFVDKILQEVLEDFE